MQQSTIRQLISLTSHFYTTVAESFSATRQQAWTGFARLEPYFQTDSPPHILDLGCGNGRLLTFLSQHVSQLTYTGLDVTASLLTEAQRTVARLFPNQQHHFIQTDFIGTLVDSQPIFSTVPNQFFTHSCAFGVFHHLPTLDLRIKLLQELIAVTRDGGYIIISLWQPLNQPERFLAKAKNPTDYGIEQSELSPNDLLLGWQNQSKAVRYCHSFTDNEITSLVTSVSHQAKLIDQFQADGQLQNLNCYLVLQKNTSIQT